MTYVVSDALSMKGIEIVSTPSNGDGIVYDSATETFVFRFVSDVADFGDLSDVAAAVTSGATQGDILWYDGSDWDRLALGTETYAITSSGGNVAWAQIDHANLANKGTNTHAQIDTAVSNSVSHIAASAPHSGHEETANKNAVSGYAGLDGSGYVAHAQLGSGGGGSTKFLREDSTWQTVAGGVTDFGDLSDVAAAVTSGATTGDLIAYDGADWDRVPATTNGYVLTLAAGSPVWAEATGGIDTIEGVAGEALSQYDLVYANVSDSGEYWIATNAGTAAQADVVGIVVESGGVADTATGTIHLGGLVTNGSWTWTPGAALYLSTAGGITETEPTSPDIVKPIGYAVTATQIWFNPQLGWETGLTGSSGDTLYHDGSDWATLSVGANGYLYTVSGGFPAWVAATESLITFDNATGHTHDGTDSTVVDHTDLSNKGTNTHAQIDTAVSNSVSHIAASAPHSGHEETANKNAANGYAGLDASGYVDHSQLGSGGGGSTKFLREDHSWQAAPTGEVYDVMDGRIEFVSATEIKWAFVKSDQVVVYYNTGTAWVLVEQSAEPTAANTDNDMGGNALTYDTNYSVFLKYSSGTAVTIEFAPWADDNQRDIAWVTATGYVLGDVRNESGSVYACIDPHTSGTFSTDLAAGKWIEVDADGLDTLDGRRIYANSAAFREYRYVGVVRLINDTGAKFVDSSQQRFILNRFNPQPKSLGMANPNSSLTQDTGVGSSWEPWENSTTKWKVELLSDGEKNIWLNAGKVEGKENTANAYISVAVALDGASSPAAESSINSMLADGTCRPSMDAYFSGVVAEGYHYLLPLIADSNDSNLTITYYSDSPLILPRIHGEIVC
jgi:hypothetical protein